MSDGTSDIRRSEATARCVSPSPDKPATVTSTTETGHDRPSPPQPDPPPVRRADPRSSELVPGTAVQVSATGVRVTRTRSTSPGTTRNNGGFKVTVNAVRKTRRRTRGSLRAYLDSALVRLRVDTGAASGSFCGNAVFMGLRGQRHDRTVPGVDYAAAEKSYTLLHPWYASEDSTGFAFTVSVLLPDLQQDIAYDPDDRTDYELLVWDSGGSWAAVNIDDEHRQAGRFFVRQRGSRRLWNEIERAFAWWILNGTPSYTRFGLTATADRQWVWLDTPDHEITGVFQRGAASQKTSPVR